ncbi:MAG: hypothetical protein WBY44_05075 [Bryobacteraceae bacterium]
MGDKEVTDDGRRILERILDTQDNCHEMLIQAKSQIDALTLALISLDSRVASRYSEQLDIEQRKQSESLETYRQQLALLRATVSTKVQ